jgi:hypothetical protein
MRRALGLVALVAVIQAVASGQTLGVLHIKVTLTDAARASVPVSHHALLISDNPSTTSPRRVVTKDDGTADVRLPPGNYTVESDEPFAFEGKGYQWTETLDVPAGRDVVLELTAKNAEVGAAPAPVPAAVPRKDDPSLPPRWQDNLVTVWTLQSRASGVIVDAAGLVVTNERGIGGATTVEVQLTPAVKVAGRVLATDREHDIAVLWIDPATAAALRPVPPGCADGRKDVEFARIAPVGEVCEVITSAEKAKLTTPAPVATRLPVEPEPPISAEVLDAEVKRRAGNLKPYVMASADFDIAFLTPVMIKGATTMEFGELAKYFAEAPAVLAVRVTPKMAESFWTKVARGAAYTQGAALPAFKHFKPGFARMRALCGNDEVTPVHPFILERRVSETDGTHEGLYVFDPGALAHCTSVKLVLFSEKGPEKPDTLTVDPKVIERISQDFAIMSPAR